ncbi:MAG: hypothetical protein GY801_30255 [bacterium]|nr:hypothetical protein [bacterium]
MTVPSVSVNSVAVPALTASSLQLSKDVAIDGRQDVRFDRTRNLTHLGVTGNCVDVKQLLKILDVAGILSTPVKSKQGRVFQRNIANADMSASAWEITMSPGR